MRRNAFAATLAAPAVCVVIVIAGAGSAAARSTHSTWASAQSEIRADGPVLAAGDDGAEDSHGGMQMSDAEMAELGHDPEGGHGESTTTDSDVPAPTSHQEGDGTTHDSPGSADHEGEATHGDEAGPAPSRPLAAVLTVFFLINGGVLTAAAVLRRRDRAKPRHRPRSATGAPATPHPA